MCVDRVANRARFLVAVLSFLAAVPLGAQEVVYVVRHVEQGRGEDPALTEAGRRRAEALAALLGEAGITAVYATEARRTRETAEPLARALGLEIRRVPREETEALIARMAREEPRGRVLVVGHSQTVPRILAALGHGEEVSIGREEYDHLFLVVRSGEGPPVVLRQRFRADPADIFAATLREDDPATLDISTEELRRLLAEGTALLLDTRPHPEWAVSHIPGALNVAPKPGMPLSLYTSDLAEVERLVDGDRSRPLVLYCNGPFCGKAKRVAAELVAAGFTDVRRYQLGAPVWRALGGVMAIEPDGARYVYERDRTAVWIDAREPEEFAAGSVPGARSLPASRVLPGKDVGGVSAAKDDGRLPMEDHNTRIIVFGRDSAQARAVAEAIAREAFHNVAYFEGGFADLRRALP